VKPPRSLCLDAVSGRAIRIAAAPSSAGQQDFPESEHPPAQSRDIPAGLGGRKNASFRHPPRHLIGHGAVLEKIVSRGRSGSAAFVSLQARSALEDQYRLVEIIIQLIYSLHSQTMVDAIVGASGADTNDCARLPSMIQDGSIGRGGQGNVT